MKLKISLLAVILCGLVLNTFADAGYVNFTAMSGSLWDEFTTPGVGVRGNANIDVAFLWNTNNSPGSLPSVGSVGNFSHRSSPSSQETATNGVLSAVSGLLGIQDLLGSGWNWASNGTSFVSTTISVTGIFTYNGGVPFQIDGTTGGSTYQFIVVGWNASAGSTAILNDNISDLGWSNPLSYLTGVSPADPNGITLFSQSGMNQFGVASVVPEPTTFALGALGGALLAFRRRK